MPSSPRTPEEVVETAAFVAESLRTLEAYRSGEHSLTLPQLNRCLEVETILLTAEGGDTLNRCYDLNS
jgi:hypothetical protein